MLAACDSHSMPLNIGAHLRIILLNFFSLFRRLVNYACGGNVIMKVLEQKEQMSGFVWIFELKAAYGLYLHFIWLQVHLPTPPATQSLSNSLFSSMRSYPYALCIGFTAFNHGHEQNTQNDGNETEKENKIVPDTIINMITTSVEKLRKFNSENECRWYLFDCFLRFFIVVFSALDSFVPQCSMLLF